MSVDPDELVALERRRIEAINTSDVAALRQLLTSDYQHVHATGRVDDRDTYLDVVAERPRVSERGAITVHQHGDCAILVGEQINTVGSDRSVFIVSQLAIRQDSSWYFALTHVGRKADVGT